MSFSFPFHLAFPFLLSFSFSLFSFLFNFPIFNCPLTTESYHSSGRCPMAAICPTNKSRVILPVNSNSKLFNVAGQKDGYSSTNCPRAIKLSNEESAVSNYTEILISIVRCRGAGRLLFTCELSACVYFKIHHSIFNIRHSISVEALSFLGVPRGLLPTLGLLQWPA